MRICLNMLGNKPYKRICFGYALGYAWTYSLDIYIYISFNFHIHCKYNIITTSFCRVMLDRIKVWNFIEI